MNPPASAYSRDVRQWEIKKANKQTVNCKLGVLSGYELPSKPVRGTTGTNQVFPGTLF